MTEFLTTILCFGGPIVRLKIGKIYHTFEMHHYCGPMRLYSDGDTPNDNFWKETSSFWPVFEKWLAQGKRIDEYGRGIVND